FALTSISMILFVCHLINEMKDLTDRLYVNWNALETSEEYNIMRKYAKNGRRYSLGYSLYCFVALYLFLSMSLIPQLLDVVLPLNKSRSILLTYPGYYFVDEREYFFYIFFHAIVAWEIAMIGIVAHDCIFVTYVEHVCSMFAVVGYAQLLEDTFNVSFAMQILIVTIGMSITLLQVCIHFNILESMRYALYIIGELIHLFFLSFEGQKLIDHSLQIRDKIYNNCWYKVSIKSQKLIILIMIKTLRLSFLSAGKIYIFSLESFTMVLQTSMSYCTVLASFQ
ncbi:PREDICTED: putative odorant receptor 85d, partial [Atta colombica]|uniref:putative odorant receptor 85d n=1 Tax=Atta colombica TaxID=520822 RepID=UPI00084BDC2D